MLSEHDIELAHPDAFDFVWGNLPAAKRADFGRHLGGCRYCQAIVDEYSEIGRIIKNLPPHVEPPADLEKRTVTAMVATLAKQRAKTDRRADVEDQAATRVYPIPQREPLAEDKIRLYPSPANQPPPAEPQARAMVTRLPVWRRYRGRLAAVAAVAAAIIAAAVIVPLRLGGALPAGAVTFELVPPQGSGQAASGTAVARPDASGSWDITLTVHHLKNFDDRQWYQCWYVSRDGRQVTSAGTFLVPYSGSGTFSMTSAADPNVFPTMQIRLQLPSKDGAIQGPVVLSGKGEKAKQ
jgi:hypothetical protein